MFKYPLLAYCHIGFWVLYGLLEHLSHVIYAQNHWQGSLFTPLLAMCCTASIALVYERFQGHWIVKAAVLLILGYGTLLLKHNVSRLLHYHMSLEELLQADFTVLIAGSSYGVLLLLTWAGLFLSSFNYLEKRGQQKELEQIRHAARDAQLQQLLYQLNPHFLFNVLNSIDVAILDKQNQTAHDMLTRLSQFLRSTLEHKLDNKITLCQELQILQHYIEIEQQRFHQIIEFEKKVAPEALEYFVPPMLLQPLVENAIKFSWQRAQISKITLEVQLQQEQQDSLCIVLCNPYDAAQSQQTNGTGTGLNNVRDRLTLLYGDQADMVTTAEQGVYRVEIHLPVEIEL